MTEARALPCLEPATGRGREQEPVGAPFLPGNLPVPTAGPNPG